MVNGITVLNNCMGLNNKVDPTRIHFDSEKGLSELAVAYNIDIDSSSRISRRKGYTKVASSNSHSLFPWGNSHLVVNNGWLSILNPDYSLENLIKVNDNAKFSYVEVGNRVYFMNGYIKGYLEDRTVHNWEIAEYVGPSTSKHFDGPPTGHLLELYNGYMFIAQDNVLWNSMPFNYHSYDLNKGNLLYPGRITMVKAVKDGLYLSDENNTYYLNGMSPREFIQTKVADYPAIEGTATLIDGSKLWNGDIRGRIVIWTSPEGICIGGPEGMFVNLTERKLTYPNANYGTGTCIGNRYVCVLV